MTVPPPGVIPLTQPVAKPLQRFGKYFLVQKLAEGGMAEIHLAKQIGAEGFERDVVVKVMKEHLCRSREFVDMFLNEARLAARLIHANIVQISDLGVADGRYFIAMEYLPGEDLQTLIDQAAKKGERVPVQLAARIILAACEGLEYAHGYSDGGKPANLVHRDVSPSNIFVTFQGAVKVLDFGIAKAGHGLRQTQPGTVKGKLGYMSPEQARGEPLDGRADLFSLGVTLHELLTGRRIFDKDSDISILLAMMQHPIPSPCEARPDIPPELEAIVMRAVQKNRDDRYPNAAAMRGDLEMFLSGNFSASGTSHIAAYMRQLFGPEQARLRTEVPKLKDLLEKGFVLPPDAVDPITGLERTLVRGSGTISAPVVVPDDSKHAETELVEALPAPVQRRSAGPWLALGAVVLLLGGSAAALRTGVVRIEGLRIPGLTPEEVVIAPVQPSEPVAPPVEPVKPPDPAPANPTTDTAAATPTPTTEPATATATPAVTSPKERRVLLDGKSITATVKRYGKQIASCGLRHRTDLPADGSVLVRFHIKNSGAVGAAAVLTAGIGSTGLGKCLKGQLSAMEFPKNRNTPEIDFEMPFRFKAQQ